MATRTTDAVSVEAVPLPTTDDVPGRAFGARVDGE